MEGVAERVGEARFLKVNDILKNIIAKGILNKVEGAVSNLADELGFLVTGGMVYAALQHATAMTMGPNRHAVGADSVKDELPRVKQVILAHGG